MTLLNPTQPIERDEPTTQGQKAPKRFKVVAVTEFLTHRPAHERYITRTGEGASVRTAAKDAIDKVFKAKTRRHQAPFKVTFTIGGE